MKICTTCKVKKTNSEFYKRTSGKLHTSCKYCQLQRKREYYQDNKQVLKEKRKHYYRNNKAKVRKCESRYRKKRLKHDVKFKMIMRIRNHLNQYLQDGKRFSSMKYLGCTLDELKTHLESKFQDGMSWDNYGRDGWHIDHIYPLSKADLTSEDECFRVFHYTNLQPLWAIDNIKKSNKIF